MSLPDRRDDTILRAVVDELAREGVVVEEAGRWLGALFAAPGKLSRREPDRNERADIAFGFRLAREIGRLDIGQTVVVKHLAPVAVEALEGTDLTIRRGGEVAGPGVVVVKTAKPNQDFRFDVPVVGLETARSVVAAQAAVLAIEAGTDALRAARGDARAPGRQPRGALGLQRGRCPGLRSSSRPARSRVTSTPRRSLIGTAPPPPRSFGVGSRRPAPRGRGPAAGRRHRTALARRHHGGSPEARVDSGPAAPARARACAPSARGRPARRRTGFQPAPRRRRRTRSGCASSTSSRRRSGPGAAAGCATSAGPSTSRCASSLSRRRSSRKPACAPSTSDTPCVDLVRPRRRRPPCAPVWISTRRAPSIALLPGSRRSEVRALLPSLLGAAQLLSRRAPRPQFIVPAASPALRPLLAPLAVEPVAARIVEGRAWDCLAAADAAVVASGTATLETALIGTPFVTVYRISPLSHAIAKPPHPRPLGESAEPAAE